MKPLVIKTCVGQSLELLVSVRDLVEAEIAVAESVDILDFKEPRKGPLAPVDATIWHQAGERFTSARLSAALGERETALAVAAAVPANFSFAKAGPYNCSSIDRLRVLWSDVRERLPQSVELVAVAYADHLAAACLSPEMIIECAASEGFDRVLIDTFAKDGRSSVDHLGSDRLCLLRHATSLHGLSLMLAGSIRRAELGNWLQIANCPAGFGVRGDVCRNGREGELDAKKIRDWQEELVGLGRGTIPNPTR